MNVAFITAEGFPLNVPISLGIGTIVNSYNISYELKNDTDHILYALAGKLASIGRISGFSFHINSANAEFLSRIPDMLKRTVARFDFIQLFIKIDDQDRKAFGYLKAYEVFLRGRVSIHFYSEKSPVPISDLVDVFNAFRRKGSQAYYQIHIPRLAYPALVAFNKKTWGMVNSTASILLDKNWSKIIAIVDRLDFGVKSLNYIVKMDSRCFYPKYFSAVMTPPKCYFRIFTMLKPFIILRIMHFMDERLFCAVLKFYRDRNNLYTDMLETSQNMASTVGLKMLFTHEEKVGASRVLQARHASEFTDKFLDYCSKCYHLRVIRNL